jgi:hypothetical protein
MHYGEKFFGADERERALRLDLKSPPGDTEPRILGA